MNELVDVRAEAVAPGDRISLSGAVVLITAVETKGNVVDLHTEYGPAIRIARAVWVALVVADDQTEAA